MDLITAILLNVTLIIGLPLLIIYWTKKEDCTALLGGPYESDPPSRIDPPSGSTDDGAVDPGLPARV